jgi:hypothetical protein
MPDSALEFMHMHCTVPKTALQHVVCIECIKLLSCIELLDHACVRDHASNSSCRCLQVGHGQQQ